MIRLTVFCCITTSLAAMLGRTADAASLVYDVDTGGAAAFAAAVSGPLDAINLDDVAANTNLNGTTILGVTFNSPADGSPLLVIPASTTFTPDGFADVIDASTNKLPATTGLHILSPGGPELGPGLNDALENDDLELVFQQGVVAFGFDHLSQSVDGISFTVVEGFNFLDQLLFSEVVAISDEGLGGPGGADFWGIVVDGGDAIRRIVIDERDDNVEFPDANIGFDSFRFQVVPEPGSLAAATLGGAALLAARRRSARGTRPDVA